MNRLTQTAARGGLISLSLSLFISLMDDGDFCRGGGSGDPDSHTSPLLDGGTLEVTAACAEMRGNTQDLLLLHHHDDDDAHCCCNTNERKRKVLGMALLILSVVLWVTFSQLSYYVFVGQDFDKPFFATYLQTSLLAVFLLKPLLLKMWNALRMQFGSNEDQEEVNLLVLIKEDPIENQGAHCPLLPPLTILFFPPI